MRVSFALLAVFLFCQAATVSAQKASFSFANGMLDDLSGNMHDAVLVGAPTVTEDRMGNASCAYSFPGTDNDYLVIPWHNDFNIPASGALSISLWYKEESANPGGFKTLFGKGSSGTIFPQDYHIGLYDLDKPSFGSTHSPILMPPGTPPYTADINGWNHLVAIYDNGNWKLFINNVPYTSTLNIAINQSSASILIGRKFAGAIDDIVFYDRAISNAEVEELYKADDFTCQTALMTTVADNSTAPDMFQVAIDPAAGTLTAKSTELPAQTYSYQIVNITGQVLHSGYINSINTIISTRALPAGAYLIRIGKERQYIFKFVKE